MSHTSDSFRIGPPRFEDGRHHRLITNPYALTLSDQPYSLAEEPSEELLQVRAYLCAVLDGGYCPFVKDIERSSGYYVSVCDADPERLNIDKVIQRLAGAFRRHAHFDFVHRQYAVTIPLTYIDAFSHGEACTEKFLKRLQALKCRHRVPLMEKKLKFEIAHPLRELGGSKVLEKAEQRVTEPLFRSPIPLIMMRAFHRADHIFMRSKKDREVYERVFGESKSDAIGWA